MPVHLVAVLTRVAVLLLLALVSAKLSYVAYGGSSDGNCDSESDCCYDYYHGKGVVAMEMAIETT
eukprot:2177443-Pleurochrysis_carterae.AAC.1